MMNLGALCLMGVLCASCSSDDDFTGDPAKDWAGTTTFFTPTDETGFSTYYTPAIGRCGDPMPFYDQKAGEFKVLYLQEYINNRSYRFHPIWGVSTRSQRLPARCCSRYGLLLLQREGWSLLHLLYGAQQQCQVH